MLSIALTSLLLVNLVAAFYYYLTLGYDYWKSREVRGPKPLVFFGTIKDVIFQKYSMSDYLTKMYEIYKEEPYIGIYVRQSPILVLHDLDIIHRVLVTDFGKFADRGIRIHEKIEPLTANLIGLDPMRWRSMRHKLSPAFTSRKLKEMFYLLDECAENLIQYLEMKINATDHDDMTIDCHEFSSRFTTDVIGLCAFGIEMEAMTCEKSPFRAMGKRIFSTDWKTLFKFRLKLLAPDIFEFFGSLMSDKEMDDFFINTTIETMNHRKNNHIVKHDFIDVLMEIRDNPEKNSEIEFTDSIFAAQLYLFFAAGFETASTTMSNALYELAIHSDVQDKLREEINEEMKRTNGAIEYEDIKNMKYLDMVFQETLRKYAPVTFMVRKSMEAYIFKSASTNKVLKIDKDQNIIIPLYAIQRDSNYFPEPDVFDPERFNDESIKSRNPMVYMPFSKGPRNCIGKSFGIMQTKVGLVKVLHRYSFEICEKTHIPYVNDPKTILLAPKNGIYLKIAPVNNNTNNTKNNNTNM